ncbi:MAG: hypothetical protein HYV96_19275 [Opitutae bacterium]|nr:hypothetical protein [Opitutae bacterium]
MRKPMIWLGALVLAVAVQAQDFTRTMTAEEQAAAGLEKLSPAELAKLKAAVERYKAGAVAVVQEQAEQKVAATEAKVQAAEQKAAATEAKVKEVEQKAAVAEAKAKEAESKAATGAGVAAERKKGPGWLSALTTLKRIADKPEAAEAMESRIAGPFTGWTGKTVFHLENGQIWQQNDDSSYVDRAVDSPKVRIIPGRLGTFWMEVDGVNPRVRVKPVKLE